MNILVVAPFTGSNRHGMVLRNYYFAKAWVEQGHKVTIVAASYVHTRHKQPKVKGVVTTNNIDGIKYLWLLTPTYKAKGVWGRIASMFVFTLQAMVLSVVHNERYDMIVASSPHPFTIYPAARFSRKNKAKLIYDIRDLWPLTLVQMSGVSENNPFIWLMQRAEDYACRVSDLVVAVPQNSQKYLKTRGLENNKFLHIGNGVMTSEQVEKIPNHLYNYLTTLKNNGYFLIGYAGTIGRVNTLDSLISSLKFCSKDVHLVILGHGEYRKILELLVEREELNDRVHFLGHLKTGQVQKFLACIDVAYLGLKKLPLFELGVSPTKINDYMLAQKAILYAVGDRNNDVKKAGCGICCPPEDISSLSNAIEKFQTMPKAELKAMGKMGHEWCMENKSIHNLSQKIIERVR